MSIRDALIRDIAFALRRHAPWRRRKDWHRDDPREAEILAGRVVDQLELSGFLFSRKPPADAPTTPGE